MKRDFNDEKFHIAIYTFKEISTNLCSERNHSKRHTVWPSIQTFLEILVFLSVTALKTHAGSRTQRTIITLLDLAWSKYYKIHIRLKFHRI